MLSHSRLVIPLVAVLIVGGLVVFFVVYNSYPEKHENIKVDNRCYELTGRAHQAYVNLTSTVKKTSLVLHLDKVEDNNASIPVGFSGEYSSIKNFIDRYHIIVKSIQNVTVYPNIVGSIVSGNISLMSISSIIKNLSIDDLSVASKSIEGSISILPSEHVTNQEIKEISLLSNKLMQNGLRNIVATQNGVSPAECRYI